MLYGESEVLDKRPSKSPPGAGMVSIKTTGRKQKDVIVCEFIRSTLVKRGENAIETKAIYQPHRPVASPTGHCGKACEDAPFPAVNRALAHVHCVRSVGDARRP